MSTLRPFFQLLGRASVIWLSVIGLLFILITMTGLARPDVRLGLTFDTVFLAIFLIPAGAGWLAGAVTQEFQHTTFAMMLPGVRRRIGSGFVATGLAVSLVVVGLIATSDASSQNLPLLFIMGLGAYCLGGVLLDPISIWITSLNVVLVLFIVGRSSWIAGFAADHPWMLAAIALGVGVIGFLRLFVRSTFRIKPFLPTSPLPGRFALEKTQGFRRQRLLRFGPSKTAWRAGYLGNESWRWVRAAAHETHGAHVMKTFSNSISRAWGLGLLILLTAWIDKGDMGFGEAVAKLINDALLRAPDIPQFGPFGGPYPIVTIVIATAVFLTALFTPVALGANLVYPLSRRQRARVHFRGSLVDMAIFLLIVSPILLALGHLAGWLVGYEVRFDFMPFFLRVVLISLVLMPLAYWGRLKLLAATRLKAENNLLGVIFGVCGFVVVAAILTYMSTSIFNSPLVELAVLAMALLVSRWIYRYKLMRFYATADLA